MLRVTYETIETVKQQAGSRLPRGFPPQEQTVVKTVEVDLVQIASLGYSGIELKWSLPEKGRVEVAKIVSVEVIS